MIYILVLLVISAVIAYLGDILGTWVGKRRLSIFGLRPRITALAVAISTGMLITLLTLTVAAILSEDVRIALFSVQQLNEERQKLAGEVESLGKERTRLLQSVTDLRAQVRIKEEELVVFRRDEPITAKVFSGGQSEAAVMASLTELIKNLTDRARERGVQVKNEETIFAENHEQLAKMAAFIATATQEVVVGALAGQNIASGEALGNVVFRVRPNPLIFKSGQEIASLILDGQLERGRIARQLQEFMDEINHEVVRLGMIGNPLTGRFGDLSSDSMLSFYDMVNQVRNLAKKIVLTAVVKEDTYAIGPLNVSFRIEEETPEP